MFVIMALMVMIVRVRVRDFAMRMFVRVRCARRRKNLVGVIIMMPIVMGMFMSVSNGTMRVRMGVSGHQNLLCRFDRSMRKRTIQVPRTAKCAEANTLG